MRREFFSDELGELFQHGRLSQVVSRCQEILCDLRALHGDVDPDVALVLYDLGRAYFEMGDDQAAFETTQETLRIDKLLFGEINVDYIRNLNNLGVLYRRVGRAPEGEMALTRALELIEKLPLDQRWEHPTILSNLAYHHMDRKDYATAERLLLESAKLCLKGWGRDHPRFVMAIKELSNVYWKMGKRLAAERSIRKAIRIFRDAAPTEDASYAILLAHLGFIQAQNGEADKARASCVAAIAILHRVRPESLKLISKIEQQLSQSVVGPQT